MACGSIPMRHSDARQTFRERGPTRSALTVSLAVAIALAAALAPPAGGLHGQQPGHTASTAATAEPEGGVDMIWAAQIPLRDGVRLNATIFKPRPQPGPLPVVFTLTPYISDTYFDRAWYFANNGYVFALVDVRGRGNSDGVFEPMANEDTDGHDVVEWLARQPWSNGKVAMWGGSYAGYNQWATLKEFPPHLATIVPAAAAHPGVDFPFRNNISGNYWIQWLTLTSGVTVQTNLFGSGEFWQQKWRQMYVEALPFAVLDSVVGNPSENFQRLLAHPEPDAYWDGMVPTPEDYRRMDLPVLTITGYYDGDQPGALEYYARHMRHGTAAGKASHFLVIGPWDHAGTRTPRQSCCGGREFGEAAVPDLNELHRAWYDWTMKDGPRPAFLENRVAYYAVGAEEWRYAETLEEITAGTRRLYLASQANGPASGSTPTSSASTEPPHRLANAGRLTDAPEAGGPVSYVYDPLDLRAGDLRRLSAEEVVDSLAGTGLFYESAPFETTTELAGFLRAELAIAMDVPDTDLAVLLSQVTPDGASRFVGWAAVRARYRNSLRRPEPVPAGQVQRYVFDGFLYTFEPIEAGNRIRLTLTSPNRPGPQKNYNAGGDVARESGNDARTATVRLFHDPEHPSFVDLPLARR
jgi:uncharacterized protein